MEILSDLIKILLPAALVLYAMYVTVRSFLVKEYEKRILELKNTHTQIVLPLRLQAYERICLLLERMRPNNILVRINEPDWTAAMLHQKMLLEIRNEYQHNFSQQVYMSTEAWQAVQQAIESLIAMVNTAADQVPKEAKSIELAKKIFELALSAPEDKISKALQILKAEIQILF